MKAISLTLSVILLAGFSHKLNHYFVKPKTEMSDTNLTIVTDKRSYNIVLHYIGETTTKNADGTETKSFIKTPWSMKQATLQLTYEYPFDEQKKPPAWLRKAPDGEATGVCFRWS